MILSTVILSMVILSMGEQVSLFLSTLILGALTGLAYDFIRLFRRLVKHSSFLCNIEDLVYWILVLILVFYFMLNRNFGEIRLFSVMGFFIGMVLYLMSISRLVLGIMLACAAFLKKVIKKAAAIILYPIKILINILKIPYSFILSIYRKLSRRGKKVLHNGGTYAKIKSRKLKEDLKIILKRI